MKVKITGEIIPNEYAWIYDFFGEPYFCPIVLENAVSAAEEDDRELILVINSPGGDVWSGFETYSRLRQLQTEGWHVEAHVTALAASAATTIMSACDTVLCSPVGQIMIHLPSCVTGGDKHDHEESIAFLNSIEESILNGYMVKSAGKADRDQLRAAMEAETWMPVQQAIDLGLVDGILGDVQNMTLTVVDLSALAGKVVNSLQEGLGLRYEALLARYEQGVQNGSLTEDPHHPVRNAQPEPAEPEPETNSWEEWAELELELERQRYSP